MTSQHDTIHNAEDLLAFCADDPVGCTSVHVDRTGAFTCGTNPTDLDSLEQRATYPKRIVDAANDRSTCGCRWIIFVRQDTPPSEMDAWHYSDIREALDNEGVELIDVVIAWDDQHVSMRYLRYRSTSYNDGSFSDAA